MQASEFIFKVPKVRKRWRRLYCTEKISDLNKAWEKTDAESTSSVKHGNSLPVARNLFNVKPSDVVDQDTSLPCYRDRAHCFTPIETINEHGLNPTEAEAVTESKGVFKGFNLKEAEAATQSKGVVFKASAGNKYTVGLFEELRTSPSDSLNVTEMSEICFQNGPHNSESSCPQQTENRRKQIQISADGEIHGHIRAKASITISDSAPTSPDVLIVQDESLSTTSDDDWESTTPPAPRSPSDQAVPDLSDLNTIATPSEHLLFASPFSMPQPDEWSMSEAQENTQISLYQQISSLEFMFTDFYY